MARLAAGDPAAAPVVVVHGLGAASEAQRPVAGRLARRFRVLAPDLPGFGKSESPPASLDVPGLADAFERWVAARDLPAAGLPGNSMGCQVVAQLAARHPRRARAVVPQGPTIDGTARSALRQAVRLSADGPFERPSLGLVQLRGARQAGVRRLRAGLSAALADRIEHTVAGVSCPVLVVRGTRDPVVSETVAARAPEGVLRVRPGAGSPECVVRSQASVGPGERRIRQDRCRWAQSRRARTPAEAALDSRAAPRHDQPSS